MKTIPEKIVMILLKKFEINVHFLQKNYYQLYDLPDDIPVAILATSRSGYLYSWVVTETVE